VEVGAASVLRGCARPAHRAFRTRARFIAPPFTAPQAAEDRGAPIPHRPRPLRNVPLVNPEKAIWSAAVLRGSSPPERNHLQKRRPGAQAS